MLTFPEIDPIIVSIGPLAVRWYGVMYLLGLAGAWWLGVRQTDKGLAPTNSRQQVEDLIFYGALGVVLGGRIGYILFYQPAAFLHNPLILFRITEGGMSFHGGLLGVIMAMWVFARKLGNHFFTIADFVAPMVPIGLGFGRLGNFINQELWGRATDVPWAMLFPADPMQLPRHPSQLYQCVLEGIVLFVFLQLVARKPRPMGMISGLFLIGYAVLRFLVEFVREPDSHIGLEMLGWMTRGQELCVPMAAAGLMICIWALRRANTDLAKEKR